MPIGKPSMADRKREKILISGPNFKLELPVESSSKLLLIWVYNVEDLLLFQKGMFDITLAVS